MDQYKFKKIEIKFTGYLLLLIFLTLLIILAILWFNNIVDKNITFLDNKRAQKTALEERINNLSGLEKEYKIISPDAKIINNLLPAQENLVDLINKIEKMAQDKNLDLSTKFEGEPAGHELKTKFTVRGYFSNVMGFYKELSSGNVLVYVKAIDISDANNMLDNAQAVIDTEVYFD